MRYSVNVGASSRTSTPSSSQCRSVGRRSRSGPVRRGGRRRARCCARRAPRGRRRRRRTARRTAGRSRRRGRCPGRSGRRGTARSGAPAHSGRACRPRYGAVPSDAPTSSEPCVLCDLDGVVWLAQVADRRLGRGGRPAAGQRPAGRVRHEQLVGRLADQEAALAAIGIPADGDVMTSAMAAAALVRARRAGAGVRRTGRRRGGRGRRRGRRSPATIPAGVDVDAVVVGFHREFDYERMRIAATAVRDGARLIGTNDDATYPTPDGPIPGGGAILAAVAHGRRAPAGDRRQAPPTDGGGGRTMIGERAGRRAADGRRPAEHRRRVRRGARLPVRARALRRHAGRAIASTCRWHRRRRPRRRRRLDRRRPTLAG